MTDESSDNTAAGWLSGVYRWFKGPPLGTNSPGSPGISAGIDARSGTPSRVGHYAIARKLGAGGMGVVYQAYDERLQRTVALKMMLGLEHDETARKRFWREARAAASVNHPNVCQIYEVGEESGNLFIAMELLEGEPLTAQLARGPLSVDQAVPIAVDMLAALGAIHARGIVHRDLKPSNVFLTRHGVKLLDFGLARPEVDPTLDSADRPDPQRHRDGDAAIHGAGAGDRRTGRRAQRSLRGGRDPVRNAGRPAGVQRPLSGRDPQRHVDRAAAGPDRIARRGGGRSGDPARAGEKPGRTSHLRRGDGRTAELRCVTSTAASHARMAQPLTRVVVLPFRVLRPDPEIDFLAFSLPDAITTSLAGIGSLIVRSSATAARFAGEAPDIKALAAEADVDRVVMGTLLRSGDQLRAATQLVEAPGGTLLTSHTVQSPLGDLFRMQDDIARRVVEGLALPLAGERDSPSPDAPHNPSAVRALSQGQRARAHLRRDAGCSSAVRAVPRARSELCAGVGASRPLPSRDRQVHRPDARQRSPRRGGIRQGHCA